MSRQIAKGSRSLTSRYFPRVKREQESELRQKLIETRDTHTRNELVLGLMSIVKSCAKKYSRRFLVDEEDLLQDLVLLAIEQVEAFGEHPADNVSVSARVACAANRKAGRLALEHKGLCPSRLSEEYGKIMQALRTCSTDEEAAAAVGVKVEHVTLARSKGERPSIDADLVCEQPDAEVYAALRLFIKKYPDVYSYAVALCDSTHKYAQVPPHKKVEISKMLASVAALAG